MYCNIMVIRSPYKEVANRGKIRRGKVTKCFPGEKFSRTNKVIEELLSNTKDNEVVVIDDE